MLRALIVEDSRLFRENFHMVFHEKFPSIIVEEAGNSEEALQRIDVKLPDFIFIDIRLSGINGLELTKKIKRGFPKVQIAMMTNHDLPEYRRAAAQFGADRFFVKDSLNWEEIKEFVEPLSKKE
jgi:DNA-binding NarL/FixJ family response regulator